MDAFMYFVGDARNFMDYDPDLDIQIPRYYIDRYAFSSSLGDAFPGCIGCDWLPH